MILRLTASLTRERTERGGKTCHWIMKCTSLQGKKSRYLFVKAFNIRLQAFSSYSRGREELTQAKKSCIELQKDVEEDVSVCPFGVFFRGLLWWQGGWGGTQKPKATRSRAWPDLVWYKTRALAHKKWVFGRSSLPKNKKFSHSNSFCRGFFPLPMQMFLTRANGARKMNLLTRNSLC